MKQNLPWQTAMLTAWLLSTTGCFGSVPKVVLLPESEKVYYYDKGDIVEADKLVCTSHGTHFRLLEAAGKNILNPGDAQ